MHELRDGMPVVGLTRNGAIFDIKAQSVPLQTQIPAQTTSQLPPPPPATPVEYRTLQGTVAAVTVNTITIEIRIINPHGVIITQRETLSVGDNCRITRGGQDIMLQAVTVNDVVIAQVHSGRAYSLELEERDRSMNVTVIDKRTENTLGTNFFIVEDRDGKIHELIVNNNTVLTRQGMIGNVRFTDVRIGDSLDLLAEYSVIREAYAYGEQGFTEGVISEIHITRAGTTIYLIDSTNTATKYHAIDGAFDVHTLRLNSRVRLRLDSKEIEAVTVLQEALNGYYTGFVNSVSTTSMVLRSGLNTNSPTVRVFFDQNTIVTDSITGQRANLSTLQRDMMVYVVLQNQQSDVARSISILTR
jgi:hypothetical protein